MTKSVASFNQHAIFELSDELVELASSFELPNPVIGGTNIGCADMVCDMNVPCANQPCTRVNISCPQGH